MKRHVALLLYVAVCGVVAQAAVPRIQGSWIVVPDKSPGYVAQDHVPLLSLQLQQSESEIVLTLGKAREARYQIGLKKTTVENGRRVTALAEWQGARFVITGERERGDGVLIPYRLVLSLDDEGDLVMERRESSETSESSSKLVFRPSPRGQ
jgi:hypothetical protein